MVIGFGKLINKYIGRGGSFKLIFGEFHYIILIAFNIKNKQENDK